MHRRNDEAYKRRKSSLSPLPPADITGVSCEAGEVADTVFDRYRVPLYKEASFKPYIIAAMIFLAKVENPVEMLKKLNAAPERIKK